MSLLYNDFISVVQKKNQVQIGRDAHWSIRPFPSIEPESQVILIHTTNVLREKQLVHVLDWDRKKVQCYLSRHVVTMKFPHST